jgi:hypothetical protein
MKRKNRMIKNITIVGLLFTCVLCVSLFLLRKLDYDICISQLAERYEVDATYSAVYGALFSDINGRVFAGMEKLEVEAEFLKVAPTIFTHTGVDMEGNYAYYANIKACRLNYFSALLWYTDDGYLIEIREYFDD